MRRELPEGACPLFLPLRVPNKVHVLRELWARGVEAVDYWSVGDPACRLESFPEVAALRREIVEVPCHQSLDDEAIDRLAVLVNEALHG